jgi:topoisomerase-4 subunit B
MAEITYTEDNIKSLDWKEHMRLRPGMYIGKLGDGAAPDDGIYILFKEIFDNSIDEFVMGNGKAIDVALQNDGTISVRDYGRGIPLGKVIDCVSQINTGGKYDSKAFKKSVGLNGVGTKAVNALSHHFKVQSVRDGQMKTAEFCEGNLLVDAPLEVTNAPNGTYLEFRPDDKIFKHYRFRAEYLENQIWNYCYLNQGLKVNFNSKTFFSKNGLLDLLTRKTSSENIRYPIIHLRGDDIEVAISHGNQYGEQYYSFVNGQFTTQGGTHLAAFREAITKTLRDFYNKAFDSADIQMSIIGAISVRIEEPVFESQTKTKLGSVNVAPEGATIRSFVAEFLRKHLDDYLHKHPDIAQEILKRILQSERERKEIAGIKKLANQRAKKAALHNKKLRDCRYHFTDVKNNKHSETTLFITEGDSASGSITKSRNVDTQAVFSLRGKPLNCFELSKKVVYENEEFNLLQHALDIEDGLTSLRYNRVVIATDADVDGMHIRLLLLTFFLQFFPDLVRQGHLFILDTPIFRVRNKKKTIYCYSEEEKQRAVKQLGNKPEITRFKGLGEISPDEFAKFIGPDIRLDPVVIHEGTDIQGILAYYMGKNTPDRQDFIIGNLRIEKDVIDNPEEIPTAAEVEA